MRQVTWNAFVVLLTLVGLLVLGQFWMALVLFLLSLVVASAIRPTISTLIGRGLSARVALALAYAGLVLGITGLSLLIIRPTLLDMQTLSDDFVTGYERAKLEWPRGGSLFQRTIAEALPPSEEIFSAVSTEGGASALGVINFAQGFFSALGQLSIVIVLSLYWSADQRRFERLSLTFLPVESHATARRMWLVVSQGVGAYVRGEFVQSVLTGLLLGAGYATIGVPYPALLAIWVAVARLIPWFGALLAILLPLLAVVGISPLLGLATSLLTFIVLLGIKSVVEPRYFDRSRYNSLLIVLFIIALTDLFGIFGGLVAPTAAVAVQLVFGQAFPRPVPQARQAVRRRLDALLIRIAEFERQVRDQTADLPPEALQDIERVHIEAAKLVKTLQE